jgi:hypothetical protein
MANSLDIFGFVLHDTLEGLERQLVQTVKERIIKEGDAFPGSSDKIVATVTVDLNKILKSAASCHTVQQLETKT